MRRQEILKLRAERDFIIFQAELEGLKLSILDFTLWNGELCLDGMPADQWLSAMLES